MNRNEVTQQKEWYLIRKMFVFLKKGKSWSDKIFHSQQHAH